MGWGYKGDLFIQQHFIIIISQYYLQSINTIYHLSSSLLNYQPSKPPPINPKCIPTASPSSPTLPPPASPSSKSSSPSSTPPNPTPPSPHRSSTPGSSALSGDERATVREILHGFQDLSWPTEIRFPNIIALGHWMRERREQRAQRAEVLRAAGEEGGEEGGAGQDEQERDEAMSVLDMVLRDVERAVEGVERMRKEIQEVGCGSSSTSSTVTDPTATGPTSTEPFSPGSASAGPTCPGSITLEPIFAESQPATSLRNNNYLDAVGMDILAILITLFAPSLLLRMLLVTFVLSRICVP